MTVNNFKITFSNFNSVRDVTPKEVTETIKAFTKRFKEPVVLQHTISDYFQYSKKEQGKAKDGHCFSLATYNCNVKGSIRLDANVLSVYGIGLDIDNKGDDQLSFEEFESRFKEYYYIFHTSHSHTKQQPRYRAILLFDQPITVERYQEVFGFFCDQLNQKIDPATKNPSRVFYYPSCPIDQEEAFFCTVNKGKLFDTSIIPVGTRSVTQSKSKKQSTKHSTPMPTFEKVDLDTLKIDGELRKSIIEGDKERHFKSDSDYAFSCITTLLFQNIIPKTIFGIIAEFKYGISNHYVSEEQIWKDIERGIAYVKAQKENSEYGIKNGVEPHYPEPDYQDPDEISKDMYARIKGYIKHKNCTETLCIKASAGVGKTRVVIRNIRRMVREEDAYIEVYVPTIKLAEEFRDRINQSKKYPPIAVEVIYGRASEDAPEDHCIKKSATNVISKVSVGVTSLLCKNSDNTEFCASYNTCNYRKQFERKCSVRIYAHQYLFIPRNSQENTRKPNLIVIDESFYKAALFSTTIKVSEIDQLLVHDVIKEALYCNSPYKYLRKHHDDPQQLIEDELHRLKHQQEELIYAITPNTLQDKAQKIAERAHNFTYSIKLLKTMQADYERIENDEAPIFLYSFERKNRDAQSEKERTSWRCVEKHKEAVRLHWQEEDKSISLIPTVYIDADLNPIIAKVFFKEIDYHEYAAERRVKIWQEITTSNSITKFTTGSSAKHLINSIKRSIERFCIQFKNERVLLVTYKKLLKRELEELPKNCDPIYFGNLRGIDKYKDHAACIVIGRYQIPFDAIDCDGIGLWHDAKNLHLKHIIRKARGFRIRNGKKLGIPVTLPQDYRLQALAEQSRECETLQAIDRLRLIYYGNKKKKVVLILSNLPLNIDIDQYILKNRAINIINKIVRKAENNVITLNAEVLYEEYKSRFTSKANAAKIISRWKKMFVNDDNIATMYGSTFKLTPYSFNKKGGKPSLCLHKRKISEDVLIESLEKIHGTSIKLQS